MVPTIAMKWCRGRGVCTEQGSRPHRRCVICCETIQRASPRSRRLRSWRSPAVWRTSAAVSEALEQTTSWGVELSAVAALVDVATPEARAAIERRLEGDDTFRRSHAVIALGQIGGPGVLEVLVGLLLNDREPEQIRSAAAEGLSWLGDQAAGPALAEALVDAEPDVRFIATSALATVGGDAQLPALGRLLTDQAMFQGAGSVADQARSAIAAIKARTAGRGS